MEVEILVNKVFEAIIMVEEKKDEQNEHELRR